MCSIMFYLLQELKIILTEELLGNFNVKYVAIDFTLSSDLSFYDKQN